MKTITIPPGTTIHDALVLLATHAETEDVATVFNGDKIQMITSSSVEGWEAVYWTSVRTGEDSEDSLVSLVAAYAQARAEHRVAYRAYMAVNGQLSEARDDQERQDLYQEVKDALDRTCDAMQAAADIDDALKAFIDTVGVQQGPPFKEDD